MAASLAQEPTDGYAACQSLCSKMLAVPPQMRARDPPPNHSSRVRRRGTNKQRSSACGPDNVTVRSVGIRLRVAFAPPTWLRLRMRGTTRMTHATPSHSPQHRLVVIPADVTQGRDYTSTLASASPNLAPSESAASSHIDTPWGS